jgi:membrane-associated protein
VVVSRFLPAVRVLPPATAGALGLAYPGFLLASLTGALVWALGHVALGAFAGASLKQIEQVIGTTGWVALGLLTLATGTVVLRRRRRAIRADQASTTGANPSES